MRRCVRPDEVSSTVRCHYMTSGRVNFTFSVRRRELFLPASVLLKCFLDASDRELFHYLVDCSPTVCLPALPSSAAAVKPLMCACSPHSLFQHQRICHVLALPEPRAAVGLQVHPASTYSQRRAGVPACSCAHPVQLQRGGREETCRLQRASSFPCTWAKPEHIGRARSMGPACAGCKITLELTHSCLSVVMS